MKIYHSVSSVILAAGNSSRMNFPKPFLPFDEERNFIEKILDTYIAAGIDDIVLVINTDMERRMRLLLTANYPSRHIELVVNHEPEKGRIHSIQQGLQNVKNRCCFIQNIDNPFITKNLLQEMIAVVTGSNYVVPAYGNKNGHPVLLGNDVLIYLSLLKGRDLDLRIELNHFEKAIVTWQHDDILANINTREDYRKYFMSCEVNM